jgi:hypothetical protein
MAFGATWGKNYQFSATFSFLGSRGTVPVHKNQDCFFSSHTNVTCGKIVRESTCMRCFWITLLFYFIISFLKVKFMGDFENN